jgi:transcriptional regulator with XRE-family HTH domain
VKRLAPARRLTPRLGRVVRARRLALELTQGGLSRASRVDQGRISALERGVRSPRWPAFVRLAVALELGASRLLVVAEAQSLAGLQNAPRTPVRPVIAVGVVVRWLREARDLTQQDVAKRARLHWTGVSLVERRGSTPRLETLVVIAAALDVRLSEIARAAESPSVELLAFAELAGPPIERRRRA